MGRNVRKDKLDGERHLLTSVMNSSSACVRGYNYDYT